jgi:hypothetical protein
MLRGPRATARSRLSKQSAQSKGGKTSGPALLQLLHCRPPVADAASGPVAIQSDMFSAAQSRVRESAEWRGAPGASKYREMPSAQSRVFSNTQCVRGLEMRVAHDEVRASLREHVRSFHSGDNTARLTQARRPAARGLRLKRMSQLP